MSKQSPAKYLDLESNVRWYVVANRTGAVFYADGNKQKFRFVERLSNKDGSLHESELVSDRAGSAVSSSGGAAVHHALARRETHHEQIAKKFAGQIAESLDTARQQRRFTEIVLVAEPHFLGILREVLGTETRALVKDEIRHEYNHGSDEEIRAQILKAIGHPNK